jgi:Uma2 family endonuclease
MIPLMAKSKVRATYADLAKLPEHLVGEIIDGDLIATPRPASPHARATSAAGSDLFGRFDGPRGPGSGGWWILDEPELHLGQDVLVPDIAGWRRERMPKMPNVPAFELPPDWICESLSPATARIDRGRKMDIYARVGVGHLWIIDATNRTLEVYRLETGRWMRVATFGGDDRARAEPFEEVELDLARWWLE